MIRLLLVLACAVWSIGQARADDVLHYGAQPAWVAPIDAPAAKPADGALTRRVLDLQVRFDDRGMHQFVRQVLRVNTPEGLLAVGNVGVAWQPGLNSATFNRIVIHRGAETIDVLKDGKSFQILRREKSLESFTLDGVLTAVMAIPDLRVGDEVEMAYTIDALNPVLQGHAEAMFPLATPLPIDRLSLRYSWPIGRAMNWKAGASVPAAVVTKAGGFQTVTFARDGWTSPEAIAGAPARYSNGLLVQVADFADWSMVAAVMRPLYAKAATIAPDSPVMTEVKRIAALSTDPAARASEAMRVVQSQVRYMARLDGLGGYTPETADTVWTGKSGDCKGKTVLLLAMLRALGITAEPALVSATDGDGLDLSLPLPGRFNHVIVRATIDGKVYWLDGTRLGDRGIATIAVPAFKWALPIDTATKSLVGLVATEPALPTIETKLVLDARGGLGKPAKASGTITYRGEIGAQMRIGLTAMDASKRDEMLRSAWNGQYGVTVKTVDWAADDKTGDVSMSFTGTADMTWSTAGMDGAQRYEADNARLGRDLAPKRDTNPDAAPVAVEGNYVFNREVILLPQGGRGFSVEGDPIDRTIAGVHYTRTASLTGERFEMTAATRTKPDEISYSDAKAADKQTDVLFAKALFVRAPADFAATGVEAGAKSAAVETTKSEPADTGDAEINRLALAGKNQDALSLVDRRVAAGEKGAATLAMRGLLLRKLDRKEEASIAYDRALATDRRNPQAIIGKAEMLVEAGRNEDALILYDRLVLIWPDAADAYRRRAAVRSDVGDSAGALADLDILVSKAPDDTDALSSRTTLNLQRGKLAEALGDARAAVKLRGDKASTHSLLANVLAVQGNRAEAVAESDKALSLDPDDYTYRVRLNYGLEADGKGRLADMLALIKLEPGTAVPIPALRAQVADKASRDAILGAYAAALAVDPDNDDIAQQRDFALGMAGDPKPYVARMDAQLTKKPDDANALNGACWARAMFRAELDKALSECDKALNAGRDAYILDSRGLVQLQRGDWAKAESDYSEAVGTQPNLASSLFGRGIARKRLGNAISAKADIAAATLIDPKIADTYAAYGVKP
jgi:tetratricopeptide (TPR) repeat protein